MYGSTANGIALNLGISLQEAEELINLYFSRFPGIKDYITNTHREALWNKYVLTPFGQRRMEYGAHQCFKGTAAYNASMRNAQNVRIQSTTSTAGLITFAAANEGVKRFDGKSICTVYDSAEFEVPLSRGAEVVEEVFYYFDDWPVKEFDFLDLPIGCEVEIGTNWGNCTTVHRGITQQELEQVILELA